MEVVAADDDVAGAADVDGAQLELQPRLRDGVLGDVRDAVLLQHQVRVSHADGAAVPPQQRARDGGGAALGHHHAGVVVAAARVVRGATVAEQRAEDVDGGHAVGGDAAVAAVPHLAVELETKVHSHLRLRNY